MMTLPMELEVSLSSPCLQAIRIQSSILVLKMSTGGGIPDRQDAVQ